MKKGAVRSSFICTCPFQTEHEMSKNAAETGGKGPHSSQKTLEGKPGDHQ